ncbi:MAG TPA: hypothetical protein DF966_10875 [Sulfitobacter sp.]|nr:hypothetical protein [Sulfitobacter sp.]
MLGDKIVFLTLGAFGFFALAGRGGFVVFDDNHGKRIRKFYGLCLLFGGGLIGFSILLLSLG